MMSLVTLSILMIIHRCAGSSDLELLMKMHPTWSFEVVSVDAMIKEASHALKSAEPSLTEDVLMAKIKANLGSDRTHIVRKIGDPKWSEHPPAFFDARENWKGCAKLIGDVEDEGACFCDSTSVVASMAADRYCIFTNETFKERFSQEWLSGCAEFCSNQPFSPWSLDFIVAHGIPTGGSYHSNEGCVPSKHEPCKHTITYYPTPESYEIGTVGAPGKLKACDDMMVYDHECPTKCSNPKYKIPLEKDLKKLTTWYWLPMNEFFMRREIQEYGPIATSLLLYDDFFEHKSGIYRKKDGATLVSMDKYIKLIGWGEENGVEYWLAVNTWDDWKDSKVFKILRGVRHVAVEYQVTAGVYVHIN